MLDHTARDSWTVVRQKLAAYIARRLPAQEVDDVLQDVLLRIFRSLGDLRDDSRFGPWVYSVARNAVTDRLRRRRLVAAEAVDPDKLAHEDDEGGEPALLGCVTPFVARLPEAYRRAITLVELEGLTQTEAARIAGVSLSGMKSRVQRGRRMMREMFESCCRLTIDGRRRVVGAEPHPRLEERLGGGAGIRARAAALAARQRVPERPAELRSEAREASEGWR